MASQDQDLKNKKKNNTIENLIQTRKKYKQMKEKKTGNKLEDKVNNSIKIRYARSLHTLVIR